jgi:hypothetical protein
VKFNHFGSWEWSNLVSLGLSTFVTKTFVTLTVFIGPLTYTLTVEYGA